MASLMEGLQIPRAAQLHAAARADTTSIETAAGPIVLRRALPIDHDQATAWCHRKLHEVQAGTEELTRLGLLTGILASGELEVHGRGLGLFYHVVALAALCWMSGPVLRDSETQAVLPPEPATVQGLLLAHPTIYRQVSDWAWGEQADWSAEGNGSGPLSSDAGLAARSPEPESPATPSPGSAA